MLTARARTPVGADVDGLIVDRLAAAEADEVRELLACHGVLVVGGQPGRDVDDHAFVRFLRSLGELMFTDGETPVPGFGDLNVVTNVGRTAPPRSVFHTDTSYVARPPAYTALRAVSVPSRGGATLFSNQYTAYETLPAQLRDRLAGRTVRHVVTGVTLEDSQESSAVHPLFLEHPVSGRTALFLSAPQRCAEVSGMSPRETSDTVSLLLAHSTHPDNVYRHSWRPGDVVIWDNRAVMHCADHSEVVGDRVMHRGMVADRR